MRRTLALIGLALASASPALAQANRGSFGLDAMVAPTTGLGFAYYVTDGLSLQALGRPGLLRYSGVFANVGAQLRWEIGADKAWSPYVSATAVYSHNGAVSVAAQNPTGTTGRPDPGSGYQRYSVQSNAGQFGVGAGLRRRMSRSLALFAEGR